MYFVSDAALECLQIVFEKVWREDAKTMLNINFDVF